MSEEQLITQPHNSFLLEAFRAFTAEGLPVPVATAMVQAHVAHARAKVEIDHVTAVNRLADETARAADQLTIVAAHLQRISSMADPVIAGQFLSLLRAGEAKRAENAAARENENNARSVSSMFEGLEDSV